MELQQRIQQLLNSPTTDKQSSEQCQTHSDQANCSIKRELLVLRNQLITKSDENTILQHSIHDERLRRFVYYYY